MNWYDVLKNKNRADYQITGEEETPVFSMKYGKDGEEIFYESGVRNFQEEIQEAAKGSTLADLILRYERGEINALNSAQGFYGDFSGVPSSYGDMLNYVNNVKNLWSSLPDDVRAKFNNSLSDFSDEVTKLSEDEFNSKYFGSEDKKEVSDVESK